MSKIQHKCCVKYNHQRYFIWALGKSKFLNRDNFQPQLISVGINIHLKIKANQLLKVHRFSYVKLERVDKKYINFAA